MRPLLVLLVFCACTEGGKGGDASFELCNGVDDDEDGAIDEGYADRDGDGLADCGDEACEVSLAPAGAVAVADTCSGDPPDEVEDPWNIEVQWLYETADGVVTMPAVGNTTDDNGDGLVDINDDPDVLVTTWHSTLLLLDGATGTAHWELSGYLEWGGTAIADIDADGDNDIVGIQSEGQVTALDGTGEVVWEAEPYTSWASLYPEITVADLDGDGEPEVIADRLVLNGEDGSVAFELEDPPTSFGSPVAADLDLDGSMEILLGGHVYDNTGALLWAGEDSEYGTFNAIANVDEDDEAEVLLVTESAALIYEHTGRMASEIDLPIFRAGVPCAADFDGDGEVEFGIPSYDVLYVVDGDGALVWEASIYDSSSAAGCSAYDFDADGDYELLYADELELYLFDGRTGEVLYDDPDHDSETYMDYPVVADIDADGSAEVVVASNDGESVGLRAYRQADDTWPAAGPGWPVHDYAGSNVLSDGTVVTEPTPSWLTDNLFRGRPPADPRLAADLAVSVTDQCVSACPAGELVVAFQVYNQGAADAPAGVPVTLYAVSGDARYAVQTVALTERVPAGAALAGTSFSAAISYFGPEGFVVRVNDDGLGEATVLDCDRSNDEAAISGPVCD